jgi:DNA polymerase III delta prime subunit
MIESEKEQTSAFASSLGTFGVSRDLWPTLERVVQESESLLIQTNKIIDDLLASLENVPIAYACDKELRDLKLYELAAGKWKVEQEVASDGALELASEGPKERCTLFWNAIRAAAYDQYFGFAVPNDNTREQIESAAFIDGQQPSHFWDLHDNLIGRIWILVAHANIVNKRSRMSDGLPPIHDLTGVFNNVKSALQKQYKNRARKTQVTDWLSASKTERFEEVQRYAAWCLLNRFQKDTFEDAQRSSCGILDKNELVTHFALLLSRGSESALGVEVSILLRVLVGRYLNREQGRLEWLSDSLREGILYVLRRQNEMDGSWEVPIPDGSTSPFFHRFSPLLHILDLDTELLRPEGAPLVEACARVLASARRTLAVEYAGWLDAKRKAQEDSRELHLKPLTNAVVVGLSIGATVYDRLKDLLSDSILRHRRAIDGYTHYKIDDIPNSLKFRDNIEKGVISPWHDWSSRRPGAVLIYGPPGTGKTTVAGIIASELNNRLGPIGTDRWRFLTLSAADFARKGADGIVACAEELFGELRRVRRCVVLLDEMEEFLRARGPDSGRDSRLVTTALLPLLQEAVKAREFILVVATNFVGGIDTAVTRQGRFDLILPLGPPDVDGRKAILSQIEPEYENTISKLPGGVTRPEFEKAIVEYSMGYSPTELKSFFLDVSEMISKSPTVLVDDHSLRVQLWRVRANRVPIALSGRAGSDWRTFQDEAERYHRYASGVEFGEETQDYWQEPSLPLRGNAGAKVPR